MNGDETILDSNLNDPFEGGSSQTQAVGGEEEEDVDRSEFINMKMSQPSSSQEPEENENTIR